MFLSRFFGGQHDHTRRPSTLNRRRPAVETLEGRQLLSTFTVTNNNDHGPGSFRQAILSSNATSGSAANTINFQISGGGVQTIALQSALPAVTHAVTIDGTTQPGIGTAPRIVLNGTNAGTGSAGLSLRAPHISVKDIAIDGYGEYGIAIYGDGSSEDTITDDYIGLTPAGNTAAGNGWGGILLCIGTHDNTISGNVISGNVGPGLEIHGGSFSNVVEGNLIGTNASETAALGNSTEGILITTGSYSNIIGGTTVADRNVISGNGGAGVQVDLDSDNNSVEGDLIGTNASGATTLGNTTSGVLIESGAAGNTVGGTTAAAANTIADNQDNGVAVTRAGVGNTIVGNLINANGFGRQTAGTGDGVFLMCTPTLKVLNNTIEFNHDWGILSADSGSPVLTGNVFQGNGLGNIHCS